MTKVDGSTGPAADPTSLLDRHGRLKSSCSISRRWSLLTLAFVTVSLVSGLVYGWPALRRNLRDAGGSTLSEKTLGGIFTAGAWSTQGGRFLFGLARDRYGTSRTALASLLCVVGGSIGIALSDPNGATQLGVSLFLIGLGSGAQLCLQPVAGLFSKAGTILASLSGAFQISGLVFLGLVSITDNRAYSFGGFAIAVTIIGFVSGIMLPRGSSFILPNEEHDDKVDKDQSKHSEDSIQCSGDKRNESACVEVIDVPIVDEEEASTNEARLCDEQTVDQTSASEQDTNLQELTQEDENSGLPNNCSLADSKEVQTQKSRWNQCRKLLIQIEYLALVSWFSICIIPLQYYVGSIGFQLEDKGDDSGFYTGLFSLLYASAAALSPLGGYLADIFGLGVAQGLAAGLCALSMFLLASGASLDSQVVGLASYGIGRMLTFGMYFSNIGKRFGYANYGLLAGLGLLISAISSLVQYPLIALAAEGKARQVNIACGCMFVGVVPYCVWLGIRERKDCNDALDEDEDQRSSNKEEEGRDEEFSV